MSRVQQLLAEHHDAWHNFRPLNENESRLVRGLTYDADAVEAVEEIARIEAEHNEDINPINDKIEKIGELQKEIQQNGMSRPIAERLQDITGDSNVFQDKGIALESFTTLPSGSNIDMALEISDNQKNILLGIGGVLVLGLVGKIIHVIWKFFAKRKETDSNRKKAEEKLIAEIQSLENFKKEAAAHPEVARMFEEFMEKSRQHAQNAEDENRVPQAIYTRLISAIINNSSEIAGNDKIAKLFGAIRQIEDRIIKGRNLTDKIANSIEDKVKDDGGKTFIAELRKEFEETIKKGSWTKNLEESRNIIDNVKNLATEKIDTSKNSTAFDKDMEVLEEIILSGKVRFFDEIITYSPFRSGGLATTDFAKEIDVANKRVESSLEKVKESIDKDVSKSLKEFANEFKDQVTLYGKTVECYVYISKSWEAFLYSYARVQHKNNLSVWGNIKEKLSNKPQLTEEDEQALRLIKKYETRGYI